MIIHAINIMLFCLFRIASIPLNWNRGLSICDSLFDVLCRIFSVAIYFFLSHIDLSQCHILSKILWLKQDGCGMELPSLLLFSAYIFIFNTISWSFDRLRWMCPYPYNKYYGDSSLYRSALHPYHSKTWTIEILKVVHVSCCFHKLVWIGTRTLSIKENETK